MRTQTRSPTPSASPSQHCANASANRRSSPPCRAPGTASPFNRTPRAWEDTMDRSPGLSVRLKLTLSYAGFLMLAGALLLAAVWVFLLRYVPDRAFLINADNPFHSVFPVRSNLLHVFAPSAAAVLAFLLVFGLVGG